MSELEVTEAMIQAGRSVLDEMLDENHGDSTERELVARVHAAMTAAGWQPIETAPKDGGDVLVYGDGSYAVAYWQNGEWHDMGDIGWAGKYGADNQPTHWMPLPAPPGG